LPWIHTYIHTNGGVFPCCTSWAGTNDALLGNVNSQSLEEIFNSEKLKQLRLDMLAGTPREDICFKCYKQEDNTHTSNRLASNDRYKHLVDNLVINTLSNGHVTPKLKFLDIRFSNICNLKCRKCHPELSSAIAAEQKGKTINIVALPENIDILEHQYDEIESLYFAGGEPTLMEQHYTILVKLIEKGRASKVSLSYNINGTNLKYKSFDLLELWKSFKNVQVSISVDGINEYAEYIRHGSSWPIVLKNISRLLDYRNTVDNFSLNYSCTVDILNVDHILELNNYFKEHSLIVKGVNLNFNMLIIPKHYNVDILPAAIKLKIVDKIEQYIVNDVNDSNLEFFSKLCFQLLKNHNYKYTNELNKFKQETMRLDKLRGEDFCSRFPQYAEMWEGIII